MKEELCCTSAFISNILSYKVKSRYWVMIEVVRRVTLFWFLSISTMHNSNCIDDLVHHQMILIIQWYFEKCSWKGGLVSWCDYEKRDQIMTKMMQSKQYRYLQIFIARYLYIYKHVQWRVDKCNFYQMIIVMCICSGCIFNTFCASIC